MSLPNPDTIVLIHGFWVTPRSWEHWKAHYESKGFTVHTPGYPGFEVEVEALRDDPTPIADLTIEAIVSHLESFLDTLDDHADPHGSLRGGAFMQVVMDHGYGCAGVGLNSAPDRRRPRHALDPAALDVPGVQESAQPPPSRRVRPQAVEVRLHQHLHRRGIAGLLRALPHPCVRTGRCSTRSWRTSSPATRTPGWTSRTPPARRCCSSPAREDHIMPSSVQASNAKHYKAPGHDHRARDLRGPATPDGRRSRLGGDRRPRPRLGAGQRKVDSRPPSSTSVTP